MSDYSMWEPLPFSACRAPRAPVPANCLTLIGFPWKPSNPAAMIRVRSWVITEAVIAMTEVELVTRSARSRCRA